MATVSEKTRQAQATQNLLSLLQGLGVLKVRATQDR
jgi:hypothetical protein